MLKEGLLRFEVFIRTQCLQALPSVGPRCIAGRIDIDNLRNKNYSTMSID